MTRTRLFGLSDTVAAIADALEGEPVRLRALPLQHLLAAEATSEAETATHPMRELSPQRLRTAFDDALAAFQENPREAYLTIEEAINRGFEMEAADDTARGNRVWLWCTHPRRVTQRP